MHARNNTASAPVNLVAANLTVSPPRLAVSQLDVWLKRREASVTQKITVTIFLDEYASSLRTYETTLIGLRDMILKTEGDTKAELPWLKLARFGNKRRPKPDGSKGQLPAMGRQRHRYHWRRAGLRRRNNRLR
jgi:hypothetical protein